MGGTGGDDAAEPHFTVFDIVTDLRRDVAALQFPLDVEGADDARLKQSRLVGQLDDHLLPRLKELSTPAVVVIAGSTGAGKSTLLNSLLREELSRASVIRPTTREPVLVYNPLDEDVVSGTPLVTTIRSVANANVPRGIALIDAPDLDSVLAENRQTAARLLEGADLWLFVTTSARYGDALPWRTLTGAVERGATVAMVLNRAPAASLTTVRGDLLNRLREHHMDSTPLFVIPDAGPHEGLLEPAVVAPIDRWLRTLGGADRARTVILRTLRGSLAALPPWVRELVAHVDTQYLAAERIRLAADTALPTVAREARSSIESGALAVGAVESRWSHLVQSARLDKAISRSGVARGSARRGRSREELLAELVATVRQAAVAALTSALDDARAALAEALSDVPGGSTLALEVGIVRRIPGEESEGTDVRSAREDGRDEDVAAVVDAWLASVTARIDDLDAESSKQVAAALRAFRPGGLTALLLAASVGQRDAEELVGRLLGNDGRDLVPAVTTDLADRATTLVLQEIELTQAALDVPALADDAAVGLSVRLAELAQLT